MPFERFEHINLVDASENFRPEHFGFGEFAFYSVEHFMIVGHFGLDFSNGLCVGVACENENAFRVIDCLAAALFGQAAFAEKLQEKIEDGRIRFFDLVEEN